MTYAIENVAGHLVAAAAGGLDAAAGHLAVMVCDARWLVRRAAAGGTEQLLSELSAAWTVRRTALRFTRSPMC